MPPSSNGLMGRILYLVLRPDMGRIPKRNLIFADRGTVAQRIRLPLGSPLEHLIFTTRLADAWIMPAYQVCLLDICFSCLDIRIRRDVPDNERKTSYIKDLGKLDLEWRGEDGYREWEPGNSADQDYLSGS